MKVKCKRCGYSWDYQGESDWYISCSRCKTTINIRKIREEKKKEEEKEKGDVIKSETSEKMEYLTTCKKKDTPLLKLSNMRGI